MQPTQVSLAKWNNVRMALDIAREARDIPAARASPPSTPDPPRPEPGVGHHLRGHADRARAGGGPRAHGHQRVLTRPWRAFAASADRHRSGVRRRAGLVSTGRSSARRTKAPAPWLRTGALEERVESGEERARGLEAQAADTQQRTARLGARCARAGSAGGATGRRRAPVAGGGTSAWRSVWPKIEQAALSPAQLALAQDFATASALKVGVTEYFMTQGAGRRTTPRSACRRRSNTAATPCARPRCCRQA